MQSKSPDALRELAVRVLKTAGAAGENADAVAAVLVQAEQDGLTEHGLALLPSLAAAIRVSEVAGWAQPEVSLPMPAVVRVDAKGGFAEPALLYAIAAVAEVAEQQGMAMASVLNGRLVGSPGYHAEKLAERGLAAMVVTETAAAFACPRSDTPPLILEQTTTLGILDVTAAGAVVLVAVDLATIGAGDLVSSVAQRLAAGPAVAAYQRRLAERARRTAAIHLDDALYDDLLLLTRGSRP